MYITEQEKIHKTLVFHLICNSNASFKEKETYLLNFFTQTEFYYDVFCESVYALMTDDTVNTLSLDDCGYVRLNFFREDDYFAGFELLSKEDILNFSDDVIVYINLALKRLYNRLISSQNISVEFFL